MPLVKFTKMQGCGNDYVYFDCTADPDLIPHPAKTAVKLSDRHFGIGGDGIILIMPSKLADYRMWMFNADGSESEMCGNGIRCVARYLCDHDYFSGDEVRIETGAGVKTIRINREKGHFVSARVDMGEPILEGLKVPVNLDLPEVVNQRIVLPGGGRSYYMTCVSMGNPHCVIFTDKITDEQVLQDGPQLENHAMFPRRANIEFVKVRNRHEVDMRVWERGTGETLACGTGASAVGVACVLNRHTDRNVTVHLLGGDLQIEWSEVDNHVFMTGPATVVCTGTVEV